MNKKISSADVARQAGVSRATVSYVLAGRKDQTIREETRRKVFDAAATLGYRPNLSARALVTGRTHLVALWMPYSYHSVFGAVIEQIMRLAKGSGFRVVTVQIYGETGETLSASGLLSEWHVDGILAFDAGGLVEEVLGRHSEEHAEIPPIVSFGPSTTGRTDFVGVDMYAGSRLALGHLRELGCRRIAYASGRSHLHPGEPRYRAYLEAMQEIGAEPLIIPLAQGWYEDAYQTLRAHVADCGCPDGLFCWNDEAAIGANRALADLGRRVPEDVALIGMDGIRETEYSVPALSTVAQPVEEMCRLAWEFLQRRLREPSLPPQQAWLPMRLEERASTARTLV